MEPWSVHQLTSEASKHHDAITVQHLSCYAQHLISNDLPVIFSLGHLAKITGVNYYTLRETVNRHREIANYRMYAVKKRSGGRRFIHSVSEDLLRVQKFINQEVLQAVNPHPSSFAFHKEGGIRKCAAKHCGARWLFQYDLKDFFYDVTEIDVFHIFKSMGYRSLLAFELSRLCTTTHLPKGQKRILNHASLTKDGENIPYAERKGYVGVLPQGAPSSPMLSNLAARYLDEVLQKFAVEHGFVYTRYADDITFSASAIPTNLSIGDIHRTIIKCIRKARFRENENKTRIAGPGSKKIVLGLLVDGKLPRLSREAYHRIDRHLHASGKYGIVATAEHEGFDSAFGFHNHLSGLISYVKDVDAVRWKEFSSRLSQIELPWERS
ncbi:MAG: reverse transcriptase family protein [Mariprofundus sp.]